VAEALTRQRVEELLKALRTKDIDRLMSLYAANMVSFDITAPLRYTGSDNKGRAWQQGLRDMHWPSRLRGTRVEHRGGRRAGSRSWPQPPERDSEERRA
jgi:ketosteroid isomerase-like protein